MQPLNPNRFGVDSIDAEELAAVTAVLRERELFRFPDRSSESRVERFEQELAAFFGIGATVAACNGTMALKAALVAARLQPGSLVGVSAYTFIASAAAVVQAGLLPVPIDNDLRLGVDAADLEEKLPHLSAVVLAYVAGHSSNAEEVGLLAQERGVPLIEDACQAMGTEVEGRAAGTIGIFGALSFQQGKLITCGEGGAILSNDEEGLDRARRYLDQGAFRGPRGAPSWMHESAVVGENGRLTEISAAILRVQLGRARRLLAALRSHRHRLLEEVPGLARRALRSHHPAGDNATNVALLARDREHCERLIRSAAEERIVLRRAWRHPFHLLAPMRRFASPRWRAACSEDLASRLLCLPVNARLLESEPLAALRGLFP